MSRGPESMASRRRIVARERRAEALKLRKAGATYAQIAEAVGYASAQVAHESVMVALRDLVPKEDVEAVREMELGRLDSLWQLHWKDAAAGNREATDKLLKIMDRRARLLGLDKPQQHQHEGVVELSWADLLKD